MAVIPRAFKTKQNSGLPTPKIILLAQRSLRVPFFISNLYDKKVLNHSLKEHSKFSLPPNLKMHYDMLNEFPRHR